MNSLGFRFLAPLLGHLVFTLVVLIFLGSSSKADSAPLSATALGGATLNLLSSSTSANGASLGFGYGAECGIQLAKEHRLSVQAFFHKAQWISELPGTKYEATTDFSNYTFIYDYFFLGSSIDYFIGGGVGMVSEQNPQTNIQNATLTDGRRKFPVQTGVSFTARAGIRTFWSTHLYSPFMLSYSYYGVTLADGQPSVVSALAGLGWEL